MSGVSVLVFACGYDSLPPFFPPSLPLTLPPSLSCRRDIGLEKFFKKSLLNSVRRRNLRTLVLNAFQQYETLTMDGCIFQFFNLLSKCHALDVERFSNCAIGVSECMGGGVWVGGGGVL